MYEIWWTDMSTPSKRGVVGLPENPTRSTIRPSLEDDIKHKVFLVDFKPFVQYVWGVDDATVDLICEQATWAIDPDALRRYNEKTNNETELYPIFTEIAEDPQCPRIGKSQRKDSESELRRVLEKRGDV